MNSSIIQQLFLNKKKKKSNSPTTTQNLKPVKQFHNKTSYQSGSTN